MFSKSQTIQKLIYEIQAILRYKKIILEIFMFEKSPNFQYDLINLFNLFFCSICTSDDEFFACTIDKNCKSINKITK